MDLLSLLRHHCHLGLKEQMCCLCIRWGNNTRSAQAGLLFIFLLFFLPSRTTTTLCFWVTARRRTCLFLSGEYRTRLIGRWVDDTSTSEHLPKGSCLSRANSRAADVLLSKTKVLRGIALPPPEYSYLNQRTIFTFMLNSSFLKIQEILNRETFLSFTRRYAVSVSVCVMFCARCRRLNWRRRARFRSTLETAAKGGDKQALFFSKYPHMYPAVLFARVSCVFWCECCASVCETKSCMDRFVMAAWVRSRVTFRRHQSL